MRKELRVRGREGEILNNAHHQKATMISSGRFLRRRLIRYLDFLTSLLVLLLSSAVRCLTPRSARRFDGKGALGGVPRSPNQDPAGRVVLSAHHCAGGGRRGAALSATRAHSVPHHGPPRLPQPFSNPRGRDTPRDFTRSLFCPGSRSSVGARNCAGHLPGP